MSRTGDKKPVGFATHITAGGIAGAMEAVSTDHLVVETMLTKFLRSYVVNLWILSKSGCNCLSRGVHQG